MVCIAQIRYYKINEIEDNNAYVPVYVQSLGEALLTIGRQPVAYHDDSYFTGKLQQNAWPILPIKFSRHTGFAYRV